MVCNRPMKVPANKPGMVAVRPQSYARGKTRGAWRQTERVPDKLDCTQNLRLQLRRPRNESWCMKKVRDLRISEAAMAPADHGRAA
jgi:hypothetical protein